MSNGVPNDSYYFSGKGLTFSHQKYAFPMAITPRLIVHGGAWNIPAAYHADHLAGVRRDL